MPLLPPPDIPLDAWTSPVASGTRAPESVSAPASRGTRLRRTVAVGALATACVASSAAVTWAGYRNLPWLHPDQASAAGAPVVVATHLPVSDLSGPLETPAALTLKALWETDLPNGWRRGKVTDTVTAPVIGFGCTAEASPVLGRSWGLNGSLTLTVLVYSAGVGPRAYTDLKSAVSACPGADLTTPEVGENPVGVEAFGILKESISFTVWRRGDVIVLASAPDPAGIDSTVLAAYDAQLETSLGSLCLDPNGAVDDTERSPYYDTASYRGWWRTDTIRPRRNPGPPARDLTTSPVVSIPGPVIEQPVVVVPEPLEPAPTRGPSALPDPVGLPRTPEVPQEPTLATDITHRVADPDGPGCGWAFTGQTPPRFNDTRATAVFRRDAQAARKVLDRRWRTYQRAKATYFERYDDYANRSEDYASYAEEVAAVAEAWAPIAEARAAYDTALTAWTEAKQARRDFVDQRETAQGDYEADLIACATPQSPRISPPSQTPTPSPVPSQPAIISTPSGAIEPNTVGATPTSAPTPTSVATPAPTTVMCPPPRPAILDQPAPTVGPKPTPAAVAQLP